MPTEKKYVLVGIRIDSQSRDLLSWALVKVAEPGDCVVAVHVSRSSDHALREKLLLEGYLDVYEGLCSVKQVDLKGQIFKGSSTRKVLIREARNYEAVALVVGISKHSALGGWTSTARYCAKRLPTTTNVLAISNGKIIFRRSNKNQLPGLTVKGDPRPSLYLIENPAARECQSEYGDSEVGSEISSLEGIQSSKDESRTSSEDSKSEILSVIYEGKKISSRSISLFAGDVMDYKPGWPLLLRASSATPQAKHARSMSVVKWVMNLPSRSPHHTPRCSTIKENPLEIESGSEIEINRTNSSMQCELQKCLEALLKTNSSACQWFSYKDLKASTAQFTSENLIGKGGSNRVYKGILPDGKAVAVKILKSSKEACKDFANEIEIISSLNHKHIMPLIGVCIKDNDLVSVYDLSSKGSLEEILHGKNKEKHALSWEVRYNVAVGIAEGLNYLHNEHPRPVIHRDVKSSNILLSDGFEPKAKPIIENGDVKGILDPNLNGNINETQMKRMVLAATLCITRSARLRPKMSEILELLKGDEGVEKWAETRHDNTESQDHNDDEVYPNSSAELHLSLAMLDIDDDSTSFSSMEQSSNLSMEEYLKERWSRSSSFN
ncbi:Kinase protein with adenine nucleotide alpha hydrolases-like domain, putative isoform 4 [Theobroma cacao]|uniref:Kinase protein with adenine nucleotide alpha hydrolases-like domain, putative isoform 4 n=1 Tax=Theobroma cacao TaxID=3641 RepID=A0A061E616_THECC|nr:Kinase protein with adenine nucleotide alpha hydrolases-like domain, putative isoform 4 [Theobroma cacao]